MRVGKHGLDGGTMFPQRIVLMGYQSFIQISNRHNSLKNILAAGWHSFRCRVLQSTFWQSVEQYTTE